MDANFDLRVLAAVVLWTINLFS